MRSLSLFGCAVVSAAVFSLAVGRAAEAAPPPNDNRADAVAMDAFPFDVHGTLVEGTVERLDPQVSECGTVSATVWYRIDTAPDGTISLAVKAAAGTAPVVRVYARGGSAIREVTCGSAAAGETATASFQTTRGSNYFVLVGRKPTSADGEFDLHADLTLPPEPPRNDRFAAATRIAHLPATVKGTTVGARTEDSDPSGCDLATGTVWYRLRPTHDGLVLMKLHANGQLDAVIGVLSRARSRLEPGSCRRTDPHGNATLAFRASHSSSYFIVVGQQQGSRAGTFSLTGLAAAAPEKFPGRQLPAHAVRATLNGLTNVNDVWNTKLTAGTTYRVAFTSPACARAELRRPKDNAILLSFNCSGYRTFTPGPDGGGRYILEVLAAPSDKPQSYRLQFAAVGADDIGVGIPIANQTVRRGSLDPRGVDVVDIYHFDVVRRSDVKLTLGVASGTEFHLVLVTENGSQLGSGTGQVRRVLEPGRYVVAVTAPPATKGGAYRLSLLVRDITSTTLTLAAPVVPLHSAVVLQPAVAPSSTGVVEIQIDRFDALAGWQFSRMIRIAAGSSATWQPPSEGNWRVRASYLGSTATSPSRSGYAYLTVH
jgi:hypothetical protein